MSKKVTYILIVCLILAIDVTVAYAFLSAVSERRQNIVSVASLNTTVEETFVPETIPQDKEVTIKKNAKVRNNSKGTSCYVRVGIDYGFELTSGLRVSLENMDTTNWVKDGEWYYYKKLLGPGEETTKLFDGVKVYADESAFGTLGEREFNIFVNHETVSNFHDGKKFDSWEDAWDLHSNAR